jgi:lysozyme
MFRLLGPHVNSGDPQAVATWKPPVAVVLDPAPERWARAALATPQTRFVWRLARKDQPDFNQPIDAVTEARRWMTEALPFVLGIAGGFWQGLNEVAVDSALAMGRYAAFEVERVRLLTMYSARAGVGALGAGIPRQLNWWRPFLPALQAARDNGGMLLLHEYAWPRLGNDESRELRHRKLYRGDASCGWEGVPAQLQVPLIISECGLDGGVVRPGWVQGWQGVVTADEYLRQLDGYSQELERDEYCLGACIYCLSDAPLEEGCRTYNIWPGVAETIVQRATPLYRATSERARGVDVSEWRGQPDWKRVAENGIAFALVRASVGTHQDREWLRNARQAQAQNLVVLPWHYQTPNDAVADQVRAHLRIIGSGWPVTWTDVETTKGVPLTDRGVREFVDRVRQAGQKIGMYSSAHMIRRCCVGSWATRLPRWWADWNPRSFGRPRLPAGWPPGWDFQQTTSAGTVPGIKPPTDLDIFSGTAAELMAWCQA